MKNKTILCLALLALAAGCFADAQPPAFPMTFYGVISASDGSQANGQPLVAMIGSTTASAVIGQTSTYNCGASACNYYITISQPDGASPAVVFSINGNTLPQSGTFSSGAITRLDFAVPSDYLTGLVLQKDGNGQATAASNYTLASGNYRADMQNGTIISGGSAWDGKLRLPVVKSASDYSVQDGSVVAAIDLGASGELDFSKPVKITLPGMAGKMAGWARGTGALTPITLQCNSQSNPTNIDAPSQRECYINSADGNDLLVWTYHFTVFAAYAPQAASPPPSGGSGASGGSSGGGGGSASPASSQNSAEVQVDAGQGSMCPVRVSRELSSSNSLSVLTTTLVNEGGNGCALTDFSVTDTVDPGYFPPDKTAYTPSGASISGSQATFLFPSFQAGESETLTYSVKGWVKPSALSAFGTPALSAKKAAAPLQVPEIKAPESGNNTSKTPAPVQQPQAEAGPLIVVPQGQAPAASSPLAALIGGQALVAGLAGMGIAACIAVAALAVYLLVVMRKKGPGQRHAGRK